MKKTLTEVWLEKRGYTDQFLRDLNNSDHRILKNAPEMVFRLKEIYDRKLVLTILPDFDCDGIMSGVTGFAGFAELGFNVRLFIPDCSKGYGFNAFTIDRLLEKYPDTQVILTCDNGISCHEGIAYASLRGIEVLVSDHHLELNKNQAAIVVDPMAMDEEYEHPEICGAHVLWQILDLYAHTYCTGAGIEQINRLRVFAGIGTVSDLMPMTFENRKLVNDAVGLCRVLASRTAQEAIADIPGSVMYRNAFAGLWELLQQFVSTGKINNPEDINEEFFGFYLSPLFNSLKRLDKNMTPAWGLFFSDSVGRSQALSQLVETNAQRKEFIESHVQSLTNTMQPFAPYIWIGDVPSGLKGLIASRFMAAYGVPVLVLDSSGRGSGRSPSWYPALNRINAKGRKKGTTDDEASLIDYLSLFQGMTPPKSADEFYQVVNTAYPIEKIEVPDFSAAGHQAAFGVYVNPQSAAKLARYLQKDVLQTYESIDKEDHDYDLLLGDSIDADIPPYVDELERFYEDLEKLRPFGRGFEKPVLMFEVDPAFCTWKIMGKEKNHLKITMDNGLDILAWNHAEIANELQAGRQLLLKGSLHRNTFAGADTVNVYADQIEVI